MTLYEFAMSWIREIFDQFQPRGKCIEAVDIGPKSLGQVPDQYKTQKTCDKAVEDDPENLEFIIINNIDNAH